MADTKFPLDGPESDESMQSDRDRDSLNGERGRSDDESVVNRQPDDDEFEDVDPDSADAQIDRDDSVEDI